MGVSALALAVDGARDGALIGTFFWFKTYQSRLGERLLHVERLLATTDGSQEPAFQLHSAWLAQRGRTPALLVEYAASACRPTVAFPYGVLVLLGVVLTFLG